MTQLQARSNNPLRRAISKLVLGLEKREKMRQGRRRYQRQPLGVMVHLCVQVDGNQYQPVCEAWAVDLSIGGIACLAEQPLDLEGNIFVSFESLLGYPCYVPICVKRCATLIGNIHQINGQFVYDISSGPGQSTQAA